VRQLSIEELDRLDGPRFDGALSNFGGLNCLTDLAAVSRALAARLDPGAVALLCVMGPVVPWEWLWFLVRGEPDKAFRRLRPGGVPWRGLRIQYPSIADARRAFAPAFRLLRTGLWERWCRRPPSAGRRIIRASSRFERCERWLEAVPRCRGCHHYLLELERV
jgi:hypothetical protein